MRYLLLLLSLANPVPADAKDLLGWLRGSDSGSSRRRTEPAKSSRSTSGNNAVVRPEFEWKVTNSWTAAHEKKFSEFVAIIGESGCKSLNACINSPTANPFYFSRTPKGKTFLADCADFPHALRMYFAWMEGLPFDYVSAPTLANPEEETIADIRYSKFGNKPASIRKIEAGKSYNAYQEMMNMIDAVSTATYRMHYDYVGDFYPAVIDRNNVKPGTIAYDPSGHVAIVFKVEIDGRIKMMDAHPDQSVTRITYDQKFSRSRPAHGAGLRNWRPELNIEPSSELPGFSKIQFAKTFQVDGQSMGYYDYLRAQLSGGNLKFNPIEELKNKVLELCSNVHDREDAVSGALKSGIQNESHPNKLPYNIYGTSGDWEEYSSPSRDARLKVAFVETRKEIERFVEMYKAGDARIVYEIKASKYSKNCDSSDKTCFLAASLMAAYEETVMNPSCFFKYTKTDGSVKKLSYTDVGDRLFKLSFDPYHCAELRWGASGEELESCRDDNTKMGWYVNEQGLRNQIERTYDARMDVDMSGTKGLGVIKAPNIDLWSYLARQI